MNALLEDNPGKQRAGHRIEGQDEHQIGGGCFGDRGEEHDIGKRIGDGDDPGPAVDIGLRLSGRDGKLFTAQ